MRISDWSSDVCSSDLPPRVKSRQSGLSAHRAPTLTGRGVFVPRPPPSPDPFAEPSRAAVRAPIRDRHAPHRQDNRGGRSEEHTSELQSLMSISYAVFCLKNKK